MEIERPQETAYLKAKFIVDRKISELKIITEPAYVEVEFQGKKDKKLQCDVIYSGKTPSDPQTWTMNKTSSIALFDKFKGDTKAWMNKAIPALPSGIFGGFGSCFFNSSFSSCSLPTS